jgi:hypothetical protein
VPRGPVGGFTPIQWKAMELGHLSSPNTLSPSAYFPEGGRLSTSCLVGFVSFLRQGLAM